MATSGTRGFTLAVAARLAILENLLAGDTTCAVAALDAARNIVDAGPALAEVGIPIDGHVALEAGLLAEFLAVSDVWLLSDAAAEASVHGSAMRSVRLRDHQPADLYLIEISDTDLTTLAVFVPQGGSIAGTPPPTAVEASPRVGVVRCDAFGLITSASASTHALLGRRNETIEGTPIVKLIHTDDREMSIANWSAAKEQRGVALRWRCRLARAEGSCLWVEVTITNEIDADGNGDVSIDLYDISREVAATDALVAERELLELLTETLPVGVAKFDARGRVEHVNGRLRDLLAPLDPQELLDQAFRGELADLELAAAFAALIDEGVGSRRVARHFGADGTVRHLEWTIRAALDGSSNVVGGALCIADITEAAQLRDALEHRARTDGLTGCLNRSGTIVALEHALADAGPVGGVGLLFIDLNDFKSINDSRGHGVGDAVLEVVARRLRRAVRSDDLVGRLGGDEFVIISPGLGSADEALVFARRIARQLQGPATIERVPVPITASIGVAWTSTTTAGELLGAADSAMYTAKQTHSVAPVLFAASNAA